MRQIKRKKKKSNLELISFAVVIKSEYFLLILTSLDFGAFSNDNNPSLILIPRGFISQGVKLVKI